MHKMNEYISTWWYLGIVLIHRASKVRRSWYNGCGTPGDTGNAYSHTKVDVQRHLSALRSQTLFLRTARIIKVLVCLIASRRRLVKYVDRNRNSSWLGTRLHDKVIELALAEFLFRVSVNDTDRNLLNPCRHPISWIVGGHVHVPGGIVDERIGSPATCGWSIIHRQKSQGRYTWPYKIPY